MSEFYKYLVFQTSYIMTQLIFFEENYIHQLPPGFTSRLLWWEVQVGRGHIILDLRRAGQLGRGIYTA